MIYTVYRIVNFEISPYLDNYRCGFIQNLISYSNMITNRCQFNTKIIWVKRKVLGFFILNNLLKLLCIILHIKRFLCKMY